MVILGKKLKMQKTCEKRFYKNIRVVSCKRPLEKNTKYSTNETILKIAYLAKAIAHAKAIYSLCKIVSLGQKLKMPTTCEKWFYKNIRVVLCKKPLEKTPNIRQMRRFWKSPIWGKGYSPWKGYSLCKMNSLGQKLKMPKTCEKRFYKNIRVVLCKEPLQKTPNILERRRFWKSAILQRLKPMQRL